MEDIPPEEFEKPAVQNPTPDGKNDENKNEILDEDKKNEEIEKDLLEIKEEPQIEIKEEKDLENINLNSDNLEINNLKSEKIIEKIAIMEFLNLLKILLIKYI